MSRPLRHVVLACLLATLAGGAWAQVRSIYTCVDAKGRRLTADRPIAECMDREQKELNGNGTVRRTHGPALTAVERAEQEQRERKAAEERQRLAEEQRLQKLLVARYPNQAVHDGERAKALQPVEDAIASGQRRIAELLQQRKALQAEAAAPRTPAETAARLKRQIEDNEQQVAAQQRFIGTQDDEKKRINTRFDSELARLRVLWAQKAGATAAAGAGAAAAPR